MKKIAILNGPNLNLLGVREPGIYGSQSFEDYFSTLKKQFPEVEFIYFQSNIEGELVSKIQEIGFDFDGIVMNPAAYTHTSVAIRDAIAAVKTPVIEVHISNISKREDFRHHSYISDVAVGTIAGLGMKGYEYGVRYFLD
ncbi:MAG: type II 3-dehydroquinate dehydratase [Pseudopedobacter saltans]|uniref:3-dehydroquinate dehydratase n=1 Tax=Pseudopedobacter saltans TaxID=151895 RepID=A0A2W5EV76_9SPHI|nr:MAG: type II 3-dehydroquinate dehydratase [Pseudopedobacter saltans]